MAFTYRAGLERALIWICQWRVRWPISTVCLAVTSIWRGTLPAAPAHDGPLNIDTDKYDYYILHCLSIVHRLLLLIQLAFLFSILAGRHLNKIKCWINQPMTSYEKSLSVTRYIYIDCVLLLLPLERYRSGNAWLLLLFSFVSFYFLFVFLFHFICFLILFLPIGHHTPDTHTHTEAASWIYFFFWFVNFFLFCLFLCVCVWWRLLSCASHSFSRPW